MKKNINNKALVFTIIVSLTSVLVLSACKSSEIAPISSLITSPDAISSYVHSYDNSIVSDVSEDEVETSSINSSSPTKPTTSNTTSYSKPTSSNPTSSNPTSSSESTSSKSTISSQSALSTSSSLSSPDEPIIPRTPQELILGKWSGSYDIVPLMKEQGYEISTPILFKATLEFTDRGMVIEILDQLSYLSAMRLLLTEILNIELGANSLTKEEFESQIGMTMDTYIESQVSLDGVTLSSSREYKFEEGALHILNSETSEYEAVTYSFSDQDTLTLTSDGIAIVYSRIR